MRIIRRRRSKAGRTRAGFPAAAETILGQRQLNRIFKSYLALGNEARLERGDKAIPMPPKKSANGVNWTPVVDSQPEAHAW